MSAGLEPESGHETFEHTADVGLRVWGASLADLFEQAAAGLVEVILDPDSVEVKDSVPVSAEGEEPEELLVGWLEEVLFAFDARGFAPAAAEVHNLDEHRVEGTLLGEPFDPERHRTRSEVKAVTYHDLAIRKVDGRYEVRIILDL